MASVSLQNVRKVYPNGFVGVEDFTLDIGDREFLVLVGPSGCGKSTTLRMVAGLETITSGTIAIDGRVVNNLPPKDRDIAMVFQNYALYPHMTVYDNMAFALKLRRRPKAEIRRAVEEAAHVLGLSDMLDRLPKQLSGGQRQRVALGRAIVRKPKVFLFDEPLSNLDAKMRVEMRSEIHRLHRHLQATIIYVTHDQIEAMTMGDRIVVMEKGLIRQVADPLTLYNTPENRFTAGFIGTPPMNFLEVAIRSENDRPVLETPAGSLEPPNAWHAFLADHRGKNGCLGIRPEDFVAATHPHQHPRSLRADVEMIEQMGAESYVHFSVSGTRMTARLPPDWPGREGDTFFIEPAMNKAHLFDTASGKALF